VNPTTWVFGGGGVGGIAWQLGMLAGLHDEGVDIASDSPLLGTSAGAVVAAKLGSGRPVEELYEEQRSGVPYEVPKGLSLRMLLTMTGHGLRSRSAVDFGRRIGRPAVAFGQDETAARRAVIEARLPCHDWGDRDVRVVAVDADTGAHRVMAKGQDVSLVDAVMASCAIPLVWPVVSVDGHRYMDGGMRSPVNLDLAPGDGPVVALAPSTRWQRWARITDQRTALADRPVRLLAMSVEVRRAQGRNPLNIGTVPAVVRAGRDQGRRDAASLSTAVEADGGP
jgi:NTE family protein